jgi:hypothetical protein
MLGCSPLVRHPPNLEIDLRSLHRNTHKSWPARGKRVTEGTPLYILSLTAGAQRQVLNSSRREDKEHRSQDWNGLITEVQSVSRQYAATFTGFFPSRQGDLLVRSLPRCGKFLFLLRVCCFCQSKPKPAPTITIAINIFARWRHPKVIFKVAKESSAADRQAVHMRSVDARRRCSALVESFPT